MTATPDEQEVKAARKFIDQALDAMEPTDIVALANKLRRASVVALLGAAAVSPVNAR